MNRTKTTVPTADARDGTSCGFLHRPADEVVAEVTAGLDALWRRVVKPEEAKRPTRPADANLLAPAELGDLLGLIATPGIVTPAEQRRITGAARKLRIRVALRLSRKVFYYSRADYLAATPALDLPTGISVQSAGHGTETRGGDDRRRAATDPKTTRAHPGTAGRASRGDLDDARAMGAERGRHRRAGRPPDSVSRILRARKAVEQTAQKEED